MRKRNVVLWSLLSVILLALCYWFFIRKAEKTVDFGNRAVSPDSARVLWYKNAVIYTLDVETFQDSDGDGTGDFNGLISRLGYIDSLGANVIWLQPFQPSPNEDDGYDVSDFTSIDPRYGDLEDFKSFVKAAKSRGIRILMDLVVNHTSVEHPWYKQARRDIHSPYRSWYNRSKEKPQNAEVGMVFPGVQKETWTYDTFAKEYYYHRFYKFQPDLNTQNPAVEAEILKIIKYWIDLGLDGFRLDAVPFVIEVVETKGERFEHQFDMLLRIRAYLKSLNKDAIILGEANVMPDETVPFFGEKADGIQMMFNFYVNQYLFYALATGKVKPLKQALEQTANIPVASQWGQFLRNHDEVDLGRLSEKEREEVYEKFGPTPEMQLYDRGIRRRFAPMTNNNRPLLELANSVMFSLPGTPVVRYGDEIGMGDDLSLKERESVRTPMQWNSTPSGGFSQSLRTVKPVIDSGMYGYEIINVARQLSDSSSLLSWSRKLIEARKACQEIAYGSKEIIETDNENVLAIRYNWQGSTLFVMHNFSASPKTIRLSAVGKISSPLTCVFPAGDSLKLSPGAEELTLPAYGYRWFRTK